MISTRYAPAVIVLLTAALIPTVIHSYVDRPHDDGLSTIAIPAALAGEIGVPSGRDAQWGQRWLDTFDWFERRYGGRQDTRLFVGRSYDAKRLYHHPELVIAYGQNFGTRSVQRLAARPDVPVHVLRGRDSNATALALYALRYDDRYIDNPVLFQLRTSLQLLVTKRKPMTIFFVRQQLPSTDAPIEGSLAEQLLFEALAAFEGQQRRTR
jgi:hypothetical protein